MPTVDEQVSSRAGSLAGTAAARQRPPAPAPEMPSDRHRPGRRWQRLVRLVLSLAVAAAVLAPQVILFREAEAARSALEARQVRRVGLAREFTERYLASVRDQTKTVPGVALDDAEPRPGKLADVARVLAMKAAVLVDEHGEILQTTPSDGDAVVDALAGRVEARRTATEAEPDGFAAEFVPASGTRPAYLGTAVRFATPYGPRMLTGATDLADTPLGTFLRLITPVAGAQMYLLDPAGHVADSNIPGHAAELADQDPGLRTALAAAGTGTYAAADGERFYAAESLAQSWQLISTVPIAALYPGSGQPRGVLPVEFVAVAAAAYLALTVTGRIVRQRRRLAVLARRDPLTGLSNRRGISEGLDRLTRPADGSERRVTVVLLDIDHFKRINDRYGHDRGDEVIRAVSGALTAAVRPGDLVGRWGGEEFIVVASDTDRHGAAIVAERLRRSVADTVVVDGDPVTVSVGYAVIADGDRGAATTRADRALYLAKSAGRNRTATVES
jgi:diguanylate cyclase (GGDEF)-like protein